MEQPKDYETFEEFIEDCASKGYQELNVFGRITYHLQDHIWKAIFTVTALGYIAGIYFGKFW